MRCSCIHLLLLKDQSEKKKIFMAIDEITQVTGIKKSTVFITFFLFLILSGLLDHKQ